jgi:aminoglycoside phosphotransferase (APT) family kinase protein
MMKDTRVWSHGDFHSENMMLGPGMTFDLTGSAHRLAIDIVDFLMVDIYRDGTK